MSKNHLMSAGNASVVMLLAGAAAFVGILLWWGAGDGDDVGVPRDTPMIVVQPKASTAPDNPALSAGRPLRATGSQARLSQQFATERRDPEWASANEAVLVAQLQSVPSQTVETGLKVRCASTLCEVRGLFPAGLDSKGREIYWNMVQGPAVQKFMAERGLTMNASTLDMGGQFNIYYSRI